MNTSHLIKGASCEECVARVLTARGYQVLAQRLHTPFAEIDILALNPRTQTLALIEVKRERMGLDSAQLVGRAQWKRLRRAHEWMCARETRDVRSLLAVVSRGGHIQWIADFLAV